MACTRVPPWFELRCLPHAEHRAHCHHGRRQVRQWCDSLRPEDEGQGTILSIWLLWLQQPHDCGCAGRLPRCWLWCEWIGEKIGTPQPIWPTSLPGRQELSDIPKGYLATDRVAFHCPEASMPQHATGWNTQPTSWSWRSWPPALLPPWTMASWWTWTRLGSGCPRRNLRRLVHWLPVPMGALQSIWCEHGLRQETSHRPLPDTTTSLASTWRTGGRPSPHRPHPWRCYNQAFVDEHRSHGSRPLNKRDETWWAGFSHARPVNRFNTYKT